MSNILFSILRHEKYLRLNFSKACMDRNALCFPIFPSFSFATGLSKVSLSTITITYCLYFSLVLYQLLFLSRISSWETKKLRFFIVLYLSICHFQRIQNIQYKVDIRIGTPAHTCTYSSKYCVFHVWTFCHADPLISAWRVKVLIWVKGW